MNRTLRYVWDCLTIHHQPKLMDSISLPMISIATTDYTSKQNGSLAVDTGSTRVTTSISLHYAFISLYDAHTHTYISMYAYDKPL